MDAQLPPITKNAFRQLIDHPSFILPFQEVSNGLGRFSAVTAYGEHLDGDVTFERADANQEYSATPLEVALTQLLKSFEEDEHFANKRYWSRLTNKLTDGEWDEYWSKHGHRDCVARSLRRLGIE